MKQLFFIGSLFLGLCAKANVADTTPAKIRIYCGANISADRQPLYVVNGKVINDSSSTFLNSIDPKQIISIEILKNKKDTETYSNSRASNGVIVITTKQTDFTPKPFCKPPEYKHDNYIL
jgi:hypothetical protein